ncbi:TetR/AcrR family transcriptional regulator [Amycolatopsis sp. FDAARGOS 1241]|uniref:TetR/AcrR family transcriptional regulator n=1 Tax=Amycolatopsis sp. FDAARGOS 1241 TaxID=2778070 RepID=UPI001950FB0C|nr:TetR/AcrR family transcriptional regulator [Amycolatopsis sp. FDAARGOS 1241]QRP45057.1 TetR/AcrR family transcriptional regulator [Amycolatopsis sp. FDAARGOS 1241]
MTRDAASAAPARPLRRDAELNRRRILESARAVFGRRGLEATLDDVAHHAGLGVGTVYRRFPSKEHLVEALFAEQLADVADLAEEALKADDPWDGFTQFVWRTVELHSADRGLREIMLSKAFGHEHVAEVKARMVPLITQVVERAQASGQLRPDVVPTDLPLLHQMIGSVIEYTHVVEPDLWRRYLPLLLDGLRAHPGRSSDLPRPGLDQDEIDQAMCAWRQPKHRTENT